MLGEWYNSVGVGLRSQKVKDQALGFHSQVLLDMIGGSLTHSSGSTDST